MNTITVTTQAELLAALKTAQGGDTVLLANGNYGDIELKNDYASTVTIKAATPGGAEFGRISLWGATNITLDGIEATNSVKVEGFSSGIAVLNAEITGTLYFRDVDNLKIDNVEVSGGNFGVVFNSVRNFSLTNSHIHDAKEDLMRITGDSYNGLIENNVVANTTGGYPLHPDIIQFMGADGNTPHDITIRGNLLYDDTNPGETNAQGIFISDPRSAGGYKNILIEENMIRTNSPNTIYINGGQENVVVRNNTLMPGFGDGGAIIRIASKSGFDNSGTTIEGNVAKALMDETKASDISDNHFYGRDADLTKLFSGTDYTTWESYVPMEGSVIDFGTDLGAQPRLLSLLKEAVSGTPAVEQVEEDTGSMPLPVPEPQPGPEPQPVSLPNPGNQTALYTQNKNAELKGWGNDFVKIGHTAAMKIDTGSISLTFNADQTTWVRGILSKDSKGIGDSISAWIDKGRLVVRFEDGERAINITTDGIETHRDYKLLLTFDEQTVKVWLDDILIGEAAADVDLSNNTNDLVIGALNGNSAAGTTDGVRSFFDGTISDVMIHGTVLTPVELAGGGNAAPQPAPAPAPIGKALLYTQSQDAELRGWGNDFVKISHTDAMAVDAGSISVTFNADQTTWVRGILSKDSKGVGDSVSAWIDKGQLMVRFEDGEKSINFTQPGIEAHRDYKLLLTFDEEKVKVWLDGNLIGEAAADVDLSNNSDALLIGAFNGNSSADTTDGVRNFFDGTISDVMIHSDVLTPAELAALDLDAHINNLSGIQGAQASAGGLLG